MEFSIAGFIVGLAVGATGVGGGSLMTPILILGFGLAPAVAVGTDLLFATVTKGFGTVFHGSRGTVIWPIVWRLAAGSVPASLLTVLVLRLVGLSETTDRLMTACLSGAIVLTAVFTLFKPQLRRLAQTEPFAFLRGLHRRAQGPGTVAAGVILGVLVTLSSVGAGVIGASVLLLLYPRLPAIAVVGTDLAHAVILTGVAGLGHLSLGTIDGELLGLLLIGSLPGIYLGTRLGFRMPDRALKPVLASVLLLVGLGMLGNAVAAQFFG